MSNSTMIIRSNPGVKRDGTKFDGDFYTDSQWARWQRGLPRKMGGYRSVNKYLTDVSRTLYDYTKDQFTYLHSGSYNKIERLYINNDDYTTSVITDRTPTTGFTVDAANLWQFDVDTDLTNNLIIAQVAPNLNNIASSAAGAIFSGTITGTAPLTPITVPAGYQVNGGLLAMHPYTMYFGSDGFVCWSVAGNPTDLTGSGSGAASVTGQKIIRGMPIRGGAGNSPSGLFWSADSVIRASFTGGAGVFQFDTISTQTSILGANCVIEYDGVMYWAGVDRFLMFNGVVREVDNQMSMNYFFDNINYQYRQKCFAFKVPRFGEIWWCYPRGTATECTHAVIFNVRENSWYDTELPNGGRSAGIFPSVFRKPILAGVNPTTSGYNLWLHETGTDEIDGTSQVPVLSYFETADLSAIAKGNDNALRITAIEPDFIQSGPMTVQVTGRANARAPEIYSAQYTFEDTADQPYQQIVMLKEQRRELRVRFESNCINGDYQMGQIIGHIENGDGTVLGG